MRNKLKNKIILLLSLLLCQTTVFGQFFYEESCTQKTGIFTPHGHAYYTANTSADPVGQGWLRLTDAKTSQLGWVLIDGSYPSNLGLTVEFDFKVWTSGTNNADGMSVFLFDADNLSFQMGYGAGALGYLSLASVSHNGMIGGYLGVGIDVHGNFSTYLRMLDNTTPAANVANTISIAGSHSSGFKYRGQKTLTATDAIAFATPTPIRPSDASYYRRLRVQIDPVGTGMDVTVYLKTSPAGAFAKIIGPNNVPDAVPSKLRVGFAGATGSLFSNHEVRDVIVKTSGDLSVYKSMSSTSCSQNNAVSVITRVSNGMVSPITGVEITDTMPKGFQLIGFNPPAGYTAGTTEIAPDGRIVYNGTVNLASLENMKLTRTGTINAAVSAVVTSAVSIKAPTGFVDNNLADNYAKADMTVEQKLFSDDVWFFGKNAVDAEGTPSTGSPGVIFKEIGGVIMPVAASGIAKVNTLENSLSVSTPSCGGAFIFYTQHNQIFNTNHQPMANGAFAGHTSSADGLAACYIGNNKYMLLSVGNAYGFNMPLNYSIIDMSLQNGLGEKSAETEIENIGMAESIEIIAVPGTFDEYWLVYHHIGSASIKIRKIAGGTVSAVIQSYPFAWGNYSYQLSASPLGDMLSLVCFRSDVTTGAKVFLFDFNNTVGQITAQREIPFPIVGLYGAIFSPNGQYIYASSYNAQYLYQYDVSSLAEIGRIQYTSSGDGGGMKIGPNGKMYVSRANTKYLAVIDNPNIPITTPGFINLSGFDLGIEAGRYIPLSTGLTPPAICPPGANLPPVAKKHLGQTDQYTPVKVKVVMGDEDPENGVINLNSVRFANPTDDGVKGTASIDATTKEVTFSPNSAYNFAEGEKVQLLYIIKDTGIPVSMCDEGELEITIKKTAVSSTLFSDDVWFFGNNEGVTGVDEVGTPKTSKGMIFKKENGVVVAYDGSGISMVNSWENSLSVSTPACNGSFIFYASHDHVYNSLHQPMEGGIGAIDNPGLFKGDRSNGDGLAACYIGHNKYLLFGVSAAEVNGQLNYYYIDMSQDNGLGKITFGGVIDVAATKVNESIELIPKVGTYDQYWLIYHDATNVTNPVNGKLKVVEINGSQANPIGGIVCEIAAPSPNTYYGMKSNTTFDRIAISVGNEGIVPIYKFNPATGQLVHLRTITERVSVYGAAFSPNGKYIYASPYLATIINQYEVETGIKVGDATFNTSGAVGSGMKLGPDGKIYIVREGSGWMATIEKPNLAFTAPGGGVTMDGFQLSRAGKGLEPSTGLTPPWIDPPTGGNTAPQAIKDVAYTYKGLPVTISPLTNDIDDAGNALLNLTEVRFADPADAVKGTISTVNKQFTFTPNTSHSFTENEVLHLEYVIKDQGIPVQLCDQGNVYILIRSEPIILIKDSCSFKPKLYVDNNVPFDYQWEYRAKSTDAWSTMAGSTTYSIDGKTPGQYQVKISHVGTTTPAIYTPIITLVQRAKHDMGNGIFYSMELLRN